MGDKVDAAKETAVKAGGYFKASKGIQHHASFPEATVINAAPRLKLPPRALMCKFFRGRPPRPGGRRAVRWCGLRPVGAIPLIINPVPWNS
jgi:hypothetical protein